jgi:hypothetical protein
MWLANLMLLIEVKIRRNIPEGPERGRGIVLLFLDLRTRKEVGSQHHAPAALPPGNTRYPLYRRLGGPQGRSDVCEKSRPYRDSIPGRSSP